MHHSNGHMLPRNQTAAKKKEKESHISDLTVVLNFYFVFVTSGHKILKIIFIQFPYDSWPNGLEKSVYRGPYNSISVHVQATLTKLN